MLERTEREEKRSDISYTRKDKGSEESICFLEVKCGLMLCIVAFVLLIAIAVVFRRLGLLQRHSREKRGEVFVFFSFFFFSSFFCCCCCCFFFCCFFFFVCLIPATAMARRWSLKLGHDRQTEKQITAIVFEFLLLLISSISSSIYKLQPTNKH